MTIPTQRVLRALLADPATERYGLEIAGLTRLLPGTIHPILMRLLAIGWIHDRMEHSDSRYSRRPIRRYYKLTAAGVDAAHEALRTAASRRVPQLGAEGHSHCECDD